MSKVTNVQIHESWKAVLADEFQKDYFGLIKQFLVREKQAGKTIYPPGSLIFNAFNSTPFDQVKVVILGQDPYHGPRQAMGLSFSVPRDVRTPASLKNIYKELATDLPGFQIPNHGDLTHWANQGVFLLNAMLTVEHKKAGSHKKIGWQYFTDAVIKTLSDQREGLIFLLWGNFARAKAEMIDISKHHVLEAAHPSPLAGGAYFGSKHFSQANQLLEQQGKSPIDWQIPA
ncbi:MAG: uracil-DNA glycosylase [Bacteroidota bacterium]